MERFVYGITLKSKTGLLCRAALATAKGAPRNDGPSVALRRMMRLWAIFMKLEGSSTYVDTYVKACWHDRKWHWAYPEFALQRHDLCAGDQGL